MKKALKIIAVVSVAAAMFISGIEKNGDRIFIGRISGDHIRCALAFVTWVCVTILLVMFLKKKPEENAPAKKGGAVIAVFAALFDAGLTFVLANLLIFARFAKPERIKSPDGEHYIVRVETSDLLGHTKYNFYVKKSGVKYRYIFDDDDPDPTLEWNDDGVRHRESFYEY
ncbi:MAG: hypothetical protein J6I47_09945 [Ruminococcus sp.]|nr:hypothetical protein [Ruminococcus sp.]